MSWFLAFVGFALLIILHEAGHFFAAKAVGMRVERFALFFPPLIARRKKGETEYAIGAIPLGGYVKITGMNPAEEIPAEHAHRAYYRQPVWKRIVVIGAGPVVNIALAFAILAGIFLANGTVKPPLVVGEVTAGLPAEGKLRVRRRHARRRRPPPHRRQLPGAAAPGPAGGRQPRGHAGRVHGPARRRGDDRPRRDVLRQGREALAVRLRLRPRGQRGRRRRRWRRASSR